MGLTLTEKIIKEHLISGILKAGEEVGIRMDQTLTQDATGTMACLQLEAIGVDSVKTEISVSYVDHNMLQTDFKNMDDHRYLQSVAARFGIYFSRPGNGICHQVHLERFGIPGKTLIGSDSHTPTNGGMGMLAIGSGGVDVAVAMAGGPFYLKMPEVIGVELSGKLNDFCSAKDVILTLLKTETVKGGIGKVYEYFGGGVITLTVPERATITNMGAELGATTSVFPSDENTLAHLKSQGREQDYYELLKDEDATYDSVIEIDLAALTPMIARPHMPDNVITVKEIAGLPLAQVAIGSCTNSSLKDLLTVAAILDGKTVHPSVSLVISPGSKQVMQMLADSGALSKIVNAGARILECTCGPCIGMGQAPPAGSNTLRTFNRNFKGRSGTKDASIYLVSPETAAASALSGVLTDPRDLGEAVRIVLPKHYTINDNLIIPPSNEPENVAIVRGLNIKPLPPPQPVNTEITGRVLIKVGDDITTDHIMPAGAKILPLRSNIPAISQYVFSSIDPDFAGRAQEWGGGIIVGGHNYGQGSSREHAALAPLYLKVRAVVVKSFARIHLANLINFGILPLSFVNEADYDRITMGQEIMIKAGDLTGVIEMIINESTVVPLNHNLNERDITLLKAGGALAYVKQIMGG